MNARPWMTPRVLLVLIPLLVAMIAPALAKAATDNGTLTVGRAIFPPCVGLPMIISGYQPPTGSYSPTGLTGGNTVVGVVDGVGCAAGAHLSVSGFSSNPGGSWLTSITCNGVTNLGAGAVSYYSAGTGTAGWYWPSSLFGFLSMAPGSIVGCTIVHN